MVIQRWQSLLLLLAAAVMACFSFATIGQINTETETYLFSALGFKYAGIATDDAPTGYALHTWYFFVLSILCVVMPLIAIFMFKNMKLQKKLVVFSILFTIADFCVALLLGYSAIEASSVSWSYSMLCAPILALFALWLAWRYICRDQKLLASVDRFR